MLRPFFYVLLITLAGYSQLPHSGVVSRITTPTGPVSTVITKRAKPGQKKDTWGQTTKEKAEFYAADDVTNFQIDLTKKWYQIAAKAWGNYGPVEFWIVGSSENAAI
mgnify:FL=1